MSPLGTETPSASPAASAALVRSTYALLLNLVTSGALGFAYWALAAHRFSPRVVGEQSALIAATVLIATVGQCNLGAVLIRFLPNAGSSGSRLLRGCYTSALALSGVVAAAVILIGRATSSSATFHMDSLPMLMFFAGSTAGTVFVLEDNALLAIRRATVIPVENAVFGVLKLAILLAVPSTNHNAMIVSWVLPMLIVPIPINVLVFRQLRAMNEPGGAEWRSTGELVRFAAADGAGSLAQQMLSTLLPLIVIARFGAVANGRFYVAVTLAWMIDLVGSSFASSLTVAGAATRERVGELIHTSGSRLLALGVPAAALAALGAPWALRIYGAGYSDNATTILRFLVVGAVFRCAVTMYAGVQRIYRNTTRIIVVQGGAVAAALVAVSVVPHRYGVNGVAAALLIVYAVVGLACAWRLWLMTGIDAAA